MAELCSYDEAYDIYDAEEIGWYAKCKCDKNCPMYKKLHTRTPKERGADKPKITCLNCKHLMFSDMYGECNKQLRIVNPSDTCEYAEPKEGGGEK